MHARIWVIYDLWFNWGREWSVWGFHRGNNSRSPWIIDNWLCTTSPEINNGTVGRNRYLTFHKERRRRVEAFLDVIQQWQRVYSEDTKETEGTKETSRKLERDEFSLAIIRKGSTLSPNRTLSLRESQIRDPIDSLINGETDRVDQWDRKSWSDNRVETNKQLRSEPDIRNRRNFAEISHW